MPRTSTAILPLHHGHAPRWLFERMKKLAGAIAEAIVLNYNQEELLKRLSDAYWFQALGNVLGFDWHSSGLTTTTLGALKEGLKNRDLGIFIAGGKGSAHKTPREIMKGSEMLGIESKYEYLLDSSRLAARIDNNALQDGYDLYHHVFIFDEHARWIVVQQGMNTITGLARRYHWYYKNSGIEEPHTGIVTHRIEKDVLNLTSKESRNNRKYILKAVDEINEWLLVDNQARLRNGELVMPHRHSLTMRDLSPRAIEHLKRLESINPRDFKELILTPGIGKTALRALSLVAEIIYDAPPSRTDPALYSFAHGGKDGYPFPVRRDLYDNTIITLEEAIKNARVGDKEKMFALKRLGEAKNLYITTR
ncbi:DUF763 domain-containing protein [Candidatus Woesearchaeota archaeon]|nr:DUF763 domain-containing protein [Candidatus Woesearchaeota archaeon]